MSEASKIPKEHIAWLRRLPKFHAPTASGIWQSHFKFQIRTFWIGLLYFIVGFALLYFFVGAIVILWWTIWTLVRIIKGAILLHDQRPIPQPTSWLFG